MSGLLVSLVYFALLLCWLALIGRGVWLWSAARRADHIGDWNTAEKLYWKAALWSFSAVLPWLFAMMLIPTWQ